MHVVALLQARVRPHHLGQDHGRGEFAREGERPHFGNATDSALLGRRDCSNSWAGIFYAPSTLPCFGENSAQMHAVQGSARTRRHLKRGRKHAAHVVEVHVEPGPGPIFRILRPCTRVDALRVLRAKGVPPGCRPRGGVVSMCSSCFELVGREQRGRAFKILNLERSCQGVYLVRLAVHTLRMG